MSWQYVLAWVLIAVNAALLVVNMRTQRQSKATLERLAALERSGSSSRVAVPMTDAELHRRGL